MIDSNAGYGAEAEQLAVQYEQVLFETVHRDALHHYPAAPSRVLDVGAGTGRDAAGLAALGHQVTAAEPTPELLAHARRLHADAEVEWIADGLPELAALSGTYDLILLTAVWMHLDEAERVRGMARLAELLAPGGRMFLRLRHGPVPPGRRMFDVTGEETIGLAAGHGLSLIEHAKHEDWRLRPGVDWTLIGLERSHG